MIPISKQKSNAWREAYNPVRGVTLARVTSMLEAGERGDLADLQWFYYFMERSEPMIFSVIQRRLSVLQAAEWDIHTIDEADEGLAQEQADFLRMVYDGIENLREALAFLFTGFFRGYAHVEKHFLKSGLIERLEPVEQWFWCRAGMFGEWQYNPLATGGRTSGVPIKRENFVVLEAPALDRMLAILYLRKALSQRDWDSYLAVYGIPSIFLIGPPNTPTDKESEYQEIAKQILSGGRGYLPNGSDIKYANAEGKAPPFLQHVEYVDEQITLLGTGGLLTMLAEKGSGTLAGNAHMETFKEIARADAIALASVMQRDIDAPLLEQFFPGQPQLAYFTFAPAMSAQSAQVTEDVLRLQKAGYTVTPADVSDKSGYQLADAQVKVRGAA